MVDKFAQEVAANKTAQVIIVCGFLGAGKTTLIERILKTPEMHQRVAVIQNEFSAKMGLESSLMKDSSGQEIQDFYEMPNGCICCAAKDDLIQTLDSLLENNEKSGRPQLDYIVVEANGLADPCLLVQTFWQDDYVMSKVQFHSCICLIDCTNFTQNLSSAEKEDANLPIGDLLVRQLVFADKILLNKSDLATTQQVDLVQEAIKKTNTLALTIQTQFSKISMEVLVQKSELQFDANKVELQGQTSHALSHSILSEVQSIYITGDTKLNLTLFQNLMGQLLWESDAMLRCKGVFSSKGSDGEERQFMLQGVQTLFEFRPITQNDLKGYRLLFVGKGIDASTLQSQVYGCTE